MANSSFLYCYERRRGDLIPVIPGLSGWADARTWVTSQGGLERANGGAASEAGLGRGVDVAVGRPMSETPGLRPRVNRRCSKTRLCEASDEAGRWTGLVTCFAGGPARGNLVRLSLVDFPLNGGPDGFHLNFGTLNCGTRQE
jgi:hypothetical protein